MFGIILFATFSKYILGREVFIQTVDSGYKASKYVPNIVEYYKALSEYEIFPNEERFLRFQIKACAHAYVLFSDSYNITNAKQFYEIVIGGYGNKQDIIRRRYKTGSDKGLVSKHTISLSCNEYRSFSLKWSAYGNLQLKRGSILILNTKDKNPIPVRAFGIRTGHGHDGSWIFTLKDIKSMCRCSCEYKSKQAFWSKENSKGYTRDEWKEKLSPKMKEIENGLKVNKFNLSKNRRRRTSAQDNRKSASYIGIVGVVILCLVVGLIILIDITAVQKNRKKSKIKPFR